jgi:hypothetical protein
MNALVDVCPRHCSKREASWYSGELFILAKAIQTWAATNNNNNTNAMTYETNQVVET